MTIYSQHPNRGKVQILATYKGTLGITSSTVTSLADMELVAPIVDALNRISGLATMPVSIYDTRNGPTGHYPQTHLASLTDRDARADLLQGAHSLWYEYVTLLLYQALTDLDDATAAAPAPVKTAIDTELEAEARCLRDALAEYSEAVPLPETDSPRYWDFGFPFLHFDGGLDALSEDTRQILDRHETGITTEQREKAITDLRLLVTAYGQYRGGEAVLETASLAIFSEPGGPDAYYLSVDAPHPSANNRDTWRVEIGRWVPDDPNDEECASFTGQTVLTCSCSAPPTATQITDLLERSEERTEQLATWAQTPIGAPLPGTAFVVTEHPTN